jgi:GDP-L-fucose synthase
MDAKATEDFISKRSKPSLIVDAAAKVGGIGANNSYPVEFFSDNLTIQGNLMRAAHKLDVANFVFWVQAASIHVIVHNQSKKSI